MKIQRVQTTEEVIQEISRWLQSNAHSPVLVLVSGGSTAPLFAAAWKSLPDKTQTNITLSLADERYGLPGHKNSNWKLLQDLGLDASDPKHIPVLSGKSSMSDTASQWQDKLSLFFSRNAPVIALLGIGEDSHIAGIKPNSPSAIEHSQLVSAYSWEDYDRITLSPLAVQKLHSALVYASSPSKLTAIDKLNETLDPVLYPSQLLKSIPDCRVLYQPQPNATIPASQK